jgi:hypothetical protein
MSDLLRVSTAFLAARHEESVLFDRWTLLGLAIGGAIAGVSVWKRFRQQRRVAHVPREAEIRTPVHAGPIPPPAELIRIIRA